jgi:SAM-dependent methyltransferase
MSDWSDGYVTEVDYTYGFYREMAPAMIRFSLVAAGYEPPPLDQFAYCELGFGQGHGLNLLAAANAQGEFWGTDFNPQHAFGARDLAKEAGLANLRVFDDSFEQFARRDLPQFDYVALHGVYSWVGAENRRHIVDFINRHLKLGGVVYASYNTLPGWAGLMPIRELLYRHTNRQSVARLPLRQRTPQALEFLRQMAELPTGYIASGGQPMKEQLGRMLKQDPNYLAHEYLNRHWDPMYFADVVSELESAKLAFACSADVSSRVDMLQMSPEIQKLFATVADPIDRESVRDFVVNQRFRRDIFVRGLRPLPPGAHSALLLETPIALVRPRPECKLEVQVGVLNLNLRPEIYVPVLDALAVQPRSGNQLMTMPALSEQGPQRLLQAIVILVGAGYAQPCGSPAAAAASSAGAQRFNRLICGRTAAMFPALNHLASPLLGSGVGVGRIAKMCLDASIQGKGNDAQARALHAWQAIKGAGQVMLKDNHPIEGDESNLAELRLQAEQFAVVAPMLKALQVFGC